MRKILFLLFLILSGTGYIFAQNASVINGVWQRTKTGDIKLFGVDNGSLHQLAVSPVGENETFGFNFVPPKEGYYVIGLSSSILANRYIFYFKPGDKLNLKVLENSYELTGENTPENKEMARWHDFVFPLEDKSIYYVGKNSIYTDFFPLFEEKLKELKNYAPSSTPNKKFNTSFENFKKYDLLTIALMFVQTPRSKHPQTEDYIDYYKHLNLPKLTKNADILNYPQGMDILMHAYMVTIKIDDKLTEDQKQEKYLDPVSYLLGGSDSNVLANDTLKGEVAVMMARANRSPASFNEYKNKYVKYVITANQKDRWKEVEAALKKNVERNNAINFKFADANGKEIALSDLKGKVVYIDVWATWCGPCRKEIPFLKKLEAEYAGNKDMVFMGINVDVSRDRQKWLDFLQTEQLPGIQVFAGATAKTALMDPYKITGIPRFILVGKDGKLIFSDAPRPSSNEIRAIFNSALKE